MAGADFAAGAESQPWSEGCSSDLVQCLASHLRYAKSKTVCSPSLQLSLRSNDEGYFSIHVLLIVNMCISVIGKTACLWSQEKVCESV